MTNGHYNFVIYLFGFSEADETLWYGYGWPVERGVTGNRVYMFMSYQWYVASNEIQKYSGNKVPNFKAAFTKNKGSTYASSGGEARDGETWLT